MSRKNFWLFQNAKIFVRCAVLFLPLNVQHCVFLILESAQRSKFLRFFVHTPNTKRMCFFVPPPGVVLDCDALRCHVSILVWNAGKVHAFGETFL